MFTLYSMPSSGNSYKARLLLAHLDLPYEHVSAEYDGDNSLTRTRNFLRKNPTGKVPTVEFDSGECLSESNAILLYFGEGTSFVPEDQLTRARMYQWMFFEQNFHEATVAVRSAVYVYPQRDMDRSPERLASLLEGGNKALDVMEVQLNKTPYLTGDLITLADICLYGYTHSADKGGFDITRGSRSGIAAWLERVRQQPGHVPLDWLPG
ncbi:MAG: glutathione S-transferase family protein [Rhizobiaceae bacterium]|nr:glutathione S-transferase family protein [Rhizobiaceae bacterium]